MAVASVGVATVDGGDGLDEMLACAAMIARERFGPGAAVREAAVIAARGRSLVVRCHLTSHPQAPSSLIVKRQTGDDARAFSDRAGVQFLSGLAGAAGIAPRYYGGDAAARLLVVEDLAGTRTLGELLAAGDHAAIEGALRALAVPMARLVTSTRGTALAERYERLRLGFPGGAALGRQREAARWREALPRAVAWFAAFGCPVGSSFDAECGRVAEAFAEPGAFLAFSHGDPAPSNNAIGPAAAWLLDFEYGAYRHALYDITGWYILCPLPEVWAAILHDSFRQHLAGMWPLASDESAYGAAWATMCTYRALAMLSWFPPDMLDADRPWAEGWTMRGALLTAALRLERAVTGVPGLAVINTAAARLARAARERWPEIGEGVPDWERIGAAR